MRTEAPRARFAPALALRRRPRLRRALALALSLLVGLAVQRSVAGAESVRAAWGPTRTVAVAARDLPAGHVVGPGDVREVALPRAAVPAGALGDLPAGRVVRAPVFEGEVVLGRRVAAPEVAGVAALVPSGARALAVPVEPGTSPALLVGHRVDVIASAAAEAGPQAVLVASAVPVVDVGERAVTLALPAEAATRVAAAIAAGAVSLALVGG